MPKPSKSSKPPRSSKSPKPESAPKSPKSQRVEMETQIANIRRRLGEMRDYKRLIAADGLEPDAEDKRLESELIVRLLYLEKQLKGPPPPRPAASAGEDEAADKGAKRRRGPRNAGRNAVRKKARKP